MQSRKAENRLFICIIEVPMMRRKLKSENGASLALALLFFVICAMVGSVVLAAATAAAGRIANLQKSDQARYTLESAADLIESQLTGWSYVRAGVTSTSEAGIVRSAPQGTSGTRTDYNLDVTSGIAVPNCMLSVFDLSKQISDVRWKDGSATRSDYGRNPGKVTENVRGSYECALVLTLDYETQNRVLPVYAEISMKPDYTIYVNLYVCEAVNERDNPSWDKVENMPTLMMTFDADFSENIGIVLKGSRQVEKTDVTVTWQKPVVIMNEKIMI
jgi:hypothetical protein